MLRDIVFLLVGAVIGALFTIIVDIIKARTVAAYWEAQERWKFKVEVYSRLLSVMRRMREQLEPAAVHGQWPEGEELTRLKETASELTEPMTLARLWLPERVTGRLETLGGRIWALRANSTKPQGANP